MRKILFIMGMIAVLVSSCGQEEILKSQSADSSLPKVTAGFEENNSRTYIEQGKWLRWTAGDQISLFYGNTLNLPYTFDGETGDNAGTFSPGEEPIGTGNDLDCLYAVYPYDSKTKITEEGVITTTLPAEQNYAENSFGVGNNTMVAITESKDDTFLKFKNVGGYLKLLLYGKDVVVKSITLQGNNNEKIAGKAVVTSVYDGEPTVEMSDEATKTITLDCGDGIKLNENAENATAFWLVVPPTIFDNGFTINVTGIDGGDFTKLTSQRVKIERNTIQPMDAIEVKLIPYVTFSASEEQIFSMHDITSDCDLEYSLDAINLSKIESVYDKVAFGGKNQLRLRGKNVKGTSRYSDMGAYFSTIKFENEVKVACTGDIRTLVDYENYWKDGVGNGAVFARLFYDCTSLTSAPKLPITTLGTSCYNEMFSGCTNLVEAPELPATTLADYCYHAMFNRCFSLTSVPELLATELAKNCYSFMFAGCTSLTEAPQLPAVTLAENCYNGMFSECEKLNKVTMLATNIKASDCLLEWLYGVSSTGTFTKAASMTTLPEGTSGIPTGWTVIDQQN